MLQYTCCAGSRPTDAEPCLLHLNIHNLLIMMLILNNLTTFHDSSCYGLAELLLCVM